MENLTFAPNQEPKTSSAKKWGIVALVLLLVATFVAGAYYFVFYNEQDETPPILSSRSGYQGLIKGGKFEFAKWEEKDITAYNKKVEAAKVAQTPAVKVYSDVNYLYAEKDITFEEAFQSVDSKAEEAAVAQYDASKGKFLIYPKTTYYDASQTEEVDPAKQIIKAGQGYFFVAKNDSEGYGFKNGAELSKIDPNICKMPSTGWYLVASNTKKLYDLVGPCLDSIKYIFVQTGSASFENGRIYKRGTQKVADVMNYELKDYYLVWIKFSETPVIKPVTPTPTPTPEPPVSTEAKLSAPQNLAAAVRDEVTVTLTWDKPRLKEGQEVTSYVLLKIFNGESKRLGEISVTRPESSGAVIDKDGKVGITIEVDKAELASGRFSFKVYGIDNNKVEGESAIVIIPGTSTTVASEKLSAPTNATVERAGAEVTIKWTASVETGTLKVGKYGITVKIKGEVVSDPFEFDAKTPDPEYLKGKEATVEIKDNQVTVKTKLSEEVTDEVVFEIYAIDQNGTKSDPAIAKLPASKAVETPVVAKLSAPKDVTATISGKDKDGTMIVTWKKPDLSANQILKGYKVTRTDDGTEKEVLFIDNEYGRVEKEGAKIEVVESKITLVLSESVEDLKIMGSVMKIYSVDQNGVSGDPATFTPTVTETSTPEAEEDPETPATTYKLRAPTISGIGTGDGYVEFLIESPINPNAQISVMEYHVTYKSKNEARDADEITINTEGESNRADIVEAQKDATGNLRVKITQLTNGSTYELKVLAVDQHGTEGTETEPFEATPEKKTFH